MIARSSEREGPEYLDNSISVCVGLALAAGGLPILFDADLVSRPAIKRRGSMLMMVLEAEIYEQRYGMETKGVAMGCLPCSVLYGRVKGVTDSFDAQEQSLNDARRSDMTLKI